MGDEHEKLIKAGWQAYGSWQLDRAEHLARQAIEQAPLHGLGWYLLGCVLERFERLREADQAFLRATRAEEAKHNPPFRVSWRRFELVVDRTRRDLERQFGCNLNEVDIILEDHPQLEVSPATAVEEGEEGEEGDGPLGRFHGPVRAELASGSLAENPRIHLFRRPHEHRVTTATEFDMEIDNTLDRLFSFYMGIS